MSRVSHLRLGLRTVSSVVLGLLVTLFAHSSSAKLALELPDGCGSATEFAQALSLRLGMDAEAVLDATSVSIRAEGLEFTLQMRVGDRQRTLRDRNCADLFRAAIVVAVALFESKDDSENTNAMAPSPNESAPLAAEVAQPRAPRSPPIAHDGIVITPSKPRTKPDTPLVTELQARFGVASGLLPKTSPQVGLGGAIRSGIFGFHLGLEALPQSSTQDKKGIGASVWAVGAQLSGLVALHERVTLSGGVLGYRVTGEGIGSHLNRKAGVWAMGPLLGLSVQPLVRGPFALGIGVQGAWLLLRPRFEVLEYKEVFRSEATALECYFSSSYQFR